MRQFDVLDRSLSIHRHYLLEASAGTGKTFSIQNIVVRLLIESVAESIPPLINQILVVTFTRAATRDLKVRIRANIDLALSYLQEYLTEKTSVEAAPDYLKAIMEKGEEAVLQAKRRLQQALFTFDQASIFTIHSFCSRQLRQHALESDLGFQSNDGLDSLPASEIKQIIRDYFRTGLREGAYSTAQLALLLKKDPEQKKLISTIRRGIPIAPQRSFEFLYLRFVEAMNRLKMEHLLCSKLLLEDFILQSDSYKNYQSGVSKADCIEKITSFAALFDKETWDFNDFDLLIKEGIVWIKALDPELQKKEPPTDDLLHYPGLRLIFQQELEPLVEEASDDNRLLARLAHDCGRHLQRFLNEEERLDPDDLLKKMERALHLPSFADKVRKEYQAAVIDEFQDTDPLQWKIFKSLFLPDDKKWKGFLYLVGDPKQSIYSFRQADIYTYLAASQALGADHCYTLDVNYRSQLPLVEALNVLFDSDQFISLPKQDSYLAYKPVKAAQKTHPFPFIEERGAVHFFLSEGQGKQVDSEEQVYFPFIANEIRCLREHHPFQFSQFAILVRDRIQALRLSTYLEARQIPYVNQKGTRLAESDALPALIHLLQAVLRSHDRGALKTALGTRLLGWTYEELIGLENLESLIFKIQHLRQSLIEKGFASFMEELLQGCWHPSGRSVQEQLLTQERGLEFLHDLQQLSDLVIEHQFEEWNSPEGIIPFLDQLAQWDDDNDERVVRLEDPAQEGVKILTLHYSKGLEFDVVFALGLIQRDRKVEELISIEREGSIILTPLPPGDPEAVKFHAENASEKMRQLYVAMTRAKYQLYVPVDLGGLVDEIPVGTASPIDLFLRKFGPSPAKDFIRFLDEKGSSHSITYSIHQMIEPITAMKDREAPMTLIPPSHVVVNHPTLIITSFTGLSRRHHTVSENNVDLSPPHDFESTRMNVHTLPSSSITGVMIHSIMEKVAFERWKEIHDPIEALPMISPFIQNSSFKRWENVLSELAFNALKTDLGMGSSFCLADLNPTQIYREIPFLFPYSEALQLEEMNCDQGLIKGVIDLVFIHEGKYYIVDWKSNWLGPTFENYHQDNLFTAMNENAYFLQSTIYAEALKRYLKLVDPRPFEECFGGSLYLFMRGMQPGLSTGIFLNNALEEIPGARG